MRNVFKMSPQKGINKPTVQPPKSNGGFGGTGEKLDVTNARPTQQDEENWSSPEDKSPLPEDIDTPATEEVVMVGRNDKWNPDQIKNEELKGKVEVVDETETTTNDHLPAQAEGPEVDVEDQDLPIDGTPGDVAEHWENQDDAISEEVTDEHA